MPVFSKRPNLLDDRQLFIDSLRYSTYAELVKPIASFIREKWPDAKVAELIYFDQNQQENELASVLTYQGKLTLTYPMETEFQITLVFEYGTASVLILKRDDHIEVKDYSISYQFGN